jgi:NTP pyrophosphatase (non-canonical NTP hydrolase)
MRLNEYQAAAIRTAAMSPSWEWRRLIFALGLVCEAGEVGDTIKKEVGHGHEPDRLKVADEMGDVLWYLACLAGEYNLTLEMVAESNIAKLARRYPDGFSTERSINRDEDPDDDLIECQGNCGERFASWAELRVHLALVPDPQYEGANHMLSKRHIGEPIQRIWPCSQCELLFFHDDPLSDHRYFDHESYADFVDDDGNNDDYTPVAIP